MSELPVHPGHTPYLPKGKELLTAVAQVGVFQYSGRMRAKTIRAFASDHLGRTL